MKLVGLSTVLFLSSVAFGGPKAFGPCVPDVEKERCYVDLGDGVRGAHCVLDVKDPSKGNGLCVYKGITAGGGKCACETDPNNTVKPQPKTINTSPKR